VVLEERLRNRKTESEERIQTRIKKARWELEQSTKFDKTINNTDLTLAKQEAVSLINAFISA